MLYYLVALHSKLAGASLNQWWPEVVARSGGQDSAYFSGWLAAVANSALPASLFSDLSPAGQQCLGSPVGKLPHLHWRHQQPADVLTTHQRMWLGPVTTCTWLGVYLQSAPCAKHTPADEHYVSTKDTHCKIWPLLWHRIVRIRVKSAISCPYQVT